MQTYRRFDKKCLAHGLAQRPVDDWYRLHGELHSLLPVLIEYKSKTGDAIVQARHR